MMFKFSFALLLIAGIAMQYDVFAEDVVFKTVLSKEVPRTIQPPDAVDCDGSTTTPAAINYTAVEIMQTPADFTAVSFRVYYTDDLNTPIYNYLNNTPAAVNFNSTTGEISYTLTGIAQTRKSLTAKVFLNAGGTGTAYLEKEFYTSQTKTLPPIGAIIPYYGSAASASSAELGGWFLCDGRSIASISDDILFPDEKAALQAVIGANLPDLRGLFLRGTDPNGTYDPTANRAIGDIQTNGFAAHTHNYDKTDTPTGGVNVTLSTNTIDVTDDGTSQVTVLQSASLNSGNHSHNLTYTPTATSSTGGGLSETRPVNAAVNYLIKARN